MSKFRKEEIEAKNFLNHYMYNEQLKHGDNISEGLPDLYLEDKSVGIEVVQSEVDIDFCLDKLMSKFSKVDYDYEKCVEIRDKFEKDSKYIEKMITLANELKENKKDLVKHEKTKYAIEKEIDVLKKLKNSETRIKHKEFVLINIEDNINSTKEAIEDCHYFKLLRINDKDFSTSTIESFRMIGYDTNKFSENYKKKLDKLNKGNYDGVIEKNLCVVSWHRNHNINNAERYFDEYMRINNEGVYPQKFNKVYIVFVTGIFIFEKTKLIILKYFDDNCSEFNEIMKKSHIDIEKIMICSGDIYG